MITSGQYDESQAAYIAYNFDYHAVESVTGFDRHEVMASINDYDDKLDKLGILGYLDIGYILTEAIVNVVPTTYYKPARQQIVSTDYCQLLSDILSDEEELAHNLDDILTQAADLCFRVHNFFVIGFSAQLEQDERNYLSSVVYPQDDYEMYTKAVELTEDAIILGCGIPKVFDEDEDAQQRIHANFVTRINRNLSRSSQRSNRH